MLGSMKRVCAALMLAALFYPLQGRAQDYPTKPITIVVLLAAGTGMDVIVRLYAEQLSQALGKPVVIDNRPGTAGPRRHPDGEDRSGRRLHAARGDQFDHGDPPVAVQADAL